MTAAACRPDSASVDASNAGEAIEAAEALADAKQKLRRIASLAWLADSHLQLYRGCEIKSQVMHDVFDVIHDIAASCGQKGGAQ